LLADYGVLKGTDEVGHATVAAAVVSIEFFSNWYENKLTKRDYALRTRFPDRTSKKKKKGN
jgi:hypothetical protein